MKSDFPKCYIDDIAMHRTLTVFEWVEMAPALGAEGLEMYEGFLLSLENAYVDGLGEAIGNHGFAMPMMCCHTDPTWERVLGLMGSGQLDLRPVIGCVCSLAESETAFSRTEAGSSVKSVLVVEG